MPSVYEFGAGVCYRRGYRFTITMHDPDSGTPVARYDLYQRCSGDEHAERVRLRDHERVVYDTAWVLPGLHWNPSSEMSRSMQPAVDLRLGPRVLLDRDSVELRYRLRPGLAGVDEPRARLAVHRSTACATHRGTRRPPDGDLFSRVAPTTRLPRASSGPRSSR